MAQSCKGRDTVRVRSFSKLLLSSKRRLTPVVGGLDLGPLQRLHKVLQVLLHSDLFPSLIKHHL